MNANRESRTGSALVTVMGLALLGVSASTTLFVYLNSRARSAAAQIAMERAFFAAEAGAERASLHAAEGYRTAAAFTGTIAGANYRANVTVGGLGSTTEYDVISTGTCDGISRTVTVRGLRRVSWARYALWYEQENPNGLVMVPGEYFKGRVYSKPVMNFHDKDLAAKGQVRFYDQAWSSADKITKTTASVNPIFDRGLILKAKIEDLNVVSEDLHELHKDALREGIILEGPTTITIDNNVMTIVNDRLKPKTQAITNLQEMLVYVKTLKSGQKTYPGNISIAAPNGLNGQVTLVAEESINITDHIRYKRNPQTVADSTDALGLIAQKGVTVQSSAPNNLDVYAHIICIEDGFGVSGYDGGKSRGNLTLYGGLVNKVRRAVGTTRPTGYIKNYIFDKRFEDTPPPFYPQRKDLEWAQWDERPGSGA